MEVIESRCLLFNLATKLDKITRSDIIRFSVEFSMSNHGIYSDVSDKSVMGVVEDYSDIFSLDGDDIVVKNSWSKEFLDTTLNSHFSEKVKEKIHEIVNKIYLEKRDIK
jgi:hypothetical protein